MATAFGVTPNTWARWERRVLAVHPAYQLRSSSSGIGLSVILIGSRLDYGLLAVYATCGD